MGKRRKTHEHSDQYGEFKPQDREEHVGLAKAGGGGGGGGGTAGRSRGGNTSLDFQRQLPKFLQPYAHMLGSQRREDEDEPTVVAEQRLRTQQQQDDEDDDDDDKAAEEEAIQRALEENPELAAQLGPEYMSRVEAAKEKELGNAAFGAKDYEAAARHFTRCIELDPKNAVFYSNRSAAAANLGRYEDALDDARAVLRLRPGWVKGHARAAAAYMGLQHFSEAKEAYEKAVRMEPDDQGLQRALDKATALELQHMREHKHVFKKARPSAGESKKQQQQRRQPGGGSGGGGGGGAPAAAAAGAAGKGNEAATGGAAAKQKQRHKGKLSFALDDEEEDA